MPVIEGKARRATFTSLKLGELSSVDSPAQQGARAVIMKRDYSADERQTGADEGWALPDGSFPIKTVADLKNAIQSVGRAKNKARAKAWIITRAKALDAADQLPEDWQVKKIEAAHQIAKYVGCEDGAHSFQDVFVENKFSQEIWPFTDALSQSIRSIVGDGDLVTADREMKINESVQQFLAAVRGISPGAADGATIKAIEDLFSKGKSTMPKSIEELQTEVTALTKRAETAEAGLAKANADMTALGDQKAKADEECATAKAALAAVNKGDLEKQVAELTGERDTLKADLAKATDETVKVEGVEIRKSAVGNAQFAAFKASESRAQRAEFEKRAQADFPLVTGSAVEIGKILKLRDGADEETRKAIDAVLESNQAMSKAGFDRFGTSDPGKEKTEKAAKASFAEKAHEIAKRDNLPLHEATSKARTEFPTEFAEAYPEQAAQ